MVLYQSNENIRFYKLYSRYGNCYWPASSLEITTLSYFCSVSRNSKFCQRYRKILPLLPMRHTSSFLKPWRAWSLSPYITANIYLRTSLIDRSHRSCLQSSIQCLLNTAQIKGRLRPLLPALCSVRSPLGTCVKSALLLNLNQPLISQNVRHRAVPVSYGPFLSLFPFQHCPWGTWVSGLMTCHTIFITVTCLFVGPSHISEPAISPVSLRRSSPLRFNLACLRLLTFLPNFTPLSLSFYQLVFPSVLVFFRTLSPTL